MTQPTAQALEQYRHGLFFIVGNSRSGTTMLQAMLTSHSRLTLPPESHFFAHLPVMRARFGDTLRPERLEDVVDYTLGPLGRFSDFGLERQAVLDAMALTPGRYEDLFVVCSALYATARGKARCGDKTPRHIMHVEEILERFPEARFIALFRDPRAVVNSERKADFGNPSAVVIARRWRRYADRHLELSHLLPPERYTTVRYEDLILKPQATLEGLAAFLGEDFEPAMLAFDKRSAAETGFPDKERWKDRTRQPIDPSRITAWREHLSRTEVQLVERTIGDRLEALGYAPMEGPRLPSAWLQLARAVDWSKSARATVVRRARLFKKRRDYARSRGPRQS